MSQESNADNLTDTIDADVKAVSIESEIVDSAVDGVSAVDSSVESSSVESSPVESLGVSGESSDDESSDTISKLPWYVVQAYSGFEYKVKQFLEERIRSAGLEDSFGEIYIPQETVTQIQNGEKKVSTKKFFPGYVLVQMDMNEDTWHLVKDTPKVSSFVGNSTSPDPISQEEVHRIMSQAEEGVAGSSIKVNFVNGEQVTVKEGAFSGYTGEVDEVRPEKGKIRVLLSIFGGQTPVELDFDQVDKIS